MSIDDNTVADNAYTHYVPLMPSFNGYTCGVCGAWVTYGEYHVCYGRFEPSWITIGIEPVPPDLTRIAAALERIADALEKIE